MTPPAAAKRPLLLWVGRRRRWPAAAWVVGRKAATKLGRKWRRSRDSFVVYRADALQQFGEWGSPRAKASARGLPSCTAQIRPRLPEKIPANRSRPRVRTDTKPPAPRDNDPTARSFPRQAFHREASGADLLRREALLERRGPSNLFHASEDRSREYRAEDCHREPGPASYQGPNAPSERRGADPRSACRNRAHKLRWGPSFDRPALPTFPNCACTRTAPQQRSRIPPRHHFRLNWQSARRSATAGQD